MAADEYDLPERVPCPFCDDEETELHSPFGTALSVATYWCRACRTAFEWVKWKDAGPPGPEPSGPSGASSRERGPAHGRE